MKRHSRTFIAMITFGILLFGCSLPRGETAIPTSTQLPSPEVESATPTEGDQPEITPTGDDALTVAEAAILAALAEYLDLDMNELDATVTEIRGQHAKGGVENGYFIAAKANDQWVIVYAGQATPYCDEIEPYNFPVDMVPECLGGDNSLVVRTEPDEESEPDADSTEDAIYAALADHLEIDVEELDVTVTEIRGEHAKGGGENGYFIAAKSNDQWVIVYAGQATPYCDAIEPYDFPVDMVPECLDDDDNLVVRTEPFEEPLSQTLGPPTWSDAMDTGANWYMVHTDNVRFSMQDGMLEMKVLEAGGYDEWGMATVPKLGDFYLEIEFETGDQCSGLDRYGVIIRAPEPNKGYIFEFSCDGHYRFYKWDGSNYVSMLEWAASTAINPGSNQTNRLGVSATGEVFKLYANDKYLNETADSDYDSGKFGLVIGSANTDNLKVYVDAASYWLIEDQD